MKQVKILGKEQYRIYSTEEIKEIIKMLDDVYRYPGIHKLPGMQSLVVRIMNRLIHGA